MAYTPVLQMQVTSVNATTVVVGPGRHTADPHTPMTSLTIVYPSGKVPVEFTQGAPVVVNLQA